MRDSLILAVGALLLAGNLWFYWRVLRPVTTLARRARALEQGDLTALEATCGGTAQIDSLRRAMASMARHVQRAQAQHAAYAERLADSREDERKRIAHELHDTTVQSLIAVAQTIDLARTWLDDAPERGREALAQARQQAADAAVDLRDRIADLRPPALEELGLGAALGLLVEKTAHPAVRLSTTGVPRRLSENSELALYRAVQEALANAVRHAAAEQIDVALDYTPEAVTLSVEDDGRGFAPPADLNDLALDGHYGLMGIRERVQGIGGTVSVTSAPARGTRVSLHLPAAVVSYDAARDPVCGTVIEAGRAYGQSVHAGRTYTFCCPVCQGAFEADPTRYV